MRTSTLIAGVQLAKIAIGVGEAMGVAVGLAIVPVVRIFRGKPSVHAIRELDNSLVAVDVEEDGKPAVAFKLRHAPDNRQHEFAVVKGSTFAEIAEGTKHIFTTVQRPFIGEVERVKHALAKEVRVEGKSEQPRWAPMSRRPAPRASDGGLTGSEKRNPVAHVLEPQPDAS